MDEHPPDAISAPRIVKLRRDAGPYRTTVGRARSKGFASEELEDQRIHDEAMDELRAGAKPRTLEEVAAEIKREDSGRGTRLLSQQERRSHRVIHLVDDEARIVTILGVGHRREVYDR